MPRRRTAALLAAVSLGLVGCGTTVQPGTTSAGGVAAPSGTDGLAEPDSNGLTSPSAARSGSSAPNGETDQIPAPVDGGGPTTSQTETTARPSAEPGRRTDFKGPVKVGIVVPDIAAIAAVFGKPGKDGSEGPKRMVDYINKHGGIDGHPIEAIIHKVDSGSNAATAMQSMCNDFTVDRPVHIVIGGGDDNGCLEKKGISAIANGMWAPDSVQLAQHRNSYYTGALALDRAIGIEMRYSAAHGLLKRGSRLGVIVEDCPTDRRVANNTVAPLAKQLGISVTLASVQCVDNLVGDIGPVTAQSQNAVLKFKVNRVTNVIIISGAEAFILAQFTQAANRQKFYPHYIVSSSAYPWQNSRPDATIQISQTAAPNITGLGTLPYLDVGPGARAINPAQRAAQAACRKADPDLGLAGGDRSNGRYFQLAGFYTACDAFFLMKAVLEHNLRNGLTFNVADIARGFGAVLSDGRTASAALAAGVFSGGAGRRDCAGSVRPFAYDKAERTFRYVGKPISVD